MGENREGKSDFWTERNNTPKSKVIIPLIKKKSDLISNGKVYD